tara:strand:- start:1164 stop:1724 length:561 start_codon:yes stop_codon:yes gene_type:complete
MVIRRINIVIRAYILQIAGSRLYERKSWFSQKEICDEIESILAEGLSIWGVRSDDGIKNAGGLRQAVYQHSPHATNRFFTRNDSVRDQELPIVFLSPNLGKRNAEAKWLKGSKRPNKSLWTLNVTGKRKLRKLYRYDQEENGGNLYIPNMEDIEAASVLRKKDTKKYRESSYTHNEVEMLNLRGVN